MKLLFLLALSSIAFPSARAASDVLGAQAKTQSDLDATISRIIPKHQFVVQVNADIETVTSKVMVEGEQVSQTAASEATISVPPLPGFNPIPPPPEVKPSGQTRQVFKSVERPILKKLSVVVMLDDALTKAQVDQVEKLARNYLISGYGNLASITVQQVKMLPQEGGLSGADGDAMAGLSKYFGWIAGFLALTVIGGLLFLLLRRKNEHQPYYSPVNRYSREDAVLEPEPSDLAPVKSQLPWQHSQQGQQGQSGQQSSSALPVQKDVPAMGFLPLPADSAFVDGRSSLLDLFLANSGTFKWYFERLPEASQCELYAALRGPAFDSLLEALELTIPQGGHTSIPPTENQMNFYKKNFDEFIRTNVWQSQQYFGFLQQLTHEQLLTLVKSENPFVIALMLKFMKPLQSADILSELPTELRVQVMQQFPRIKSVAPDELVSIEKNVRARVQELPKFILGAANEDIVFWTKILTHAKNQEEILVDLESNRPDLYEKLARFRFSLDDLTTLPLPLVTKVLDEIDNDDLTKALLSLPGDIKDYVLSEVNPKRQELLRDQLVSYAGLPTEVIQAARFKVTQKFREVMA